VSERKLRAVVGDLEEWDYVLVFEYRRPDRSKGANVYRFAQALLTSAAHGAGLVSGEADADTSAAHGAGLVVSEGEPGQARHTMPVDKRGRHGTQDDLRLRSDRPTNRRQEGRKGHDHLQRCPQGPGRPRRQRGRGSRSSGEGTAAGAARETAEGAGRRRSVAAQRTSAYCLAFNEAAYCAIRCVDLL